MYNNCVIAYFGWFWGPSFWEPPISLKQDSHIFMLRIPTSKSRYWHLFWWCNTLCECRSLRCAEQAVFPISLCVTAFFNARVTGNLWICFERFWEACARWSKHCRSVRSWVRAGWGKFGSATGTIVQTYSHHIPISPFIVNILIHVSSASPLVWLQSGFLRLVQRNAATALSVPVRLAASLAVWQWPFSGSGSLLWPIWPIWPTWPIGLRCYFRQRLRESPRSLGCTGSRAHADTSKGRECH